MADKTDTAKLTDLLEALCLEFEGFRYLYKQSETRWAVHLNDYRKANRDRLRRTFDEVREHPQRTPHSDPACRELIDTLEKVMLS